MSGYIGTSRDRTETENEGRERRMVNYKKSYHMTSILH